jgi:Na+/H+-translocating membrane pyrophosphatase
VTKKSDREGQKQTGSLEPGGWAGPAAIAGAAIGSAALAAALLYSSRRKERAEKAKAKLPLDPIDTD